MPPQQADALLDFLSQIADLGTHDRSPLQLGGVSGGWR
jgi:hypothetical protein